MNDTNRLYRVEQVIIDLHQLELCCLQTDARVAVQNNPIEVLHYLIQAHPRLVTRQELIEQVWNGNGYVGEKALTNAIWQLRSHFEKLGLQDFIQTIRKRGYRLGITPKAVAVPDVVDQAQLDSSAPSDNQGAGSQSWSQRLLALPLTEYLRLHSILVITILGLLLLAIYHLLNNTSAITQVQAPIEMLTTGNGRAQFPEVSPDGERVAYAWRTFTGTSNIYWQLTTRAAERQQLTFSEHREIYPVWDFTGQYVLFVRLYSDGDGCGVYQVEVNTKREWFLTECRRTGPNYLAAHPSKAELYFNGLTRSSSNLYRLSLVHGEPEIEHIPCTLYCEAVRDFAVSPNGEYLAISRRGNRFSEDVYVLNLASGEERRLTHNIVDVIGLSWHPNSTAIIFGAAESGSRNGYLVDIESAAVTQLPLENFGSPSRVQSDGTIYYHTLGSRMQLSSLLVGQNTPSALFPLTMSDYHYRDPHLNSSTGEFVFVSNRSGSDELWVADSQFRNTRKLTSLNTIVRFPRWSRDGRRIAFVARFPETQHDVLSVLDTATGQIEQLYQFQRVLGRPTWWHDDSRIIIRENRNLHSFSLAEKSMQQLTGNGGIFAQSTPLGDVYFTKGTNLGLWQLHPDGSESKVLPGEIFGTRYSWAVTATGVYFYHQQRQAETLSFYSFSQNKVEDILAIPPELISVQSTFTFDEVQQRLIIESWQPRSQIARARLQLLMQ